MRGSSRLVDSGLLWLRVLMGLGMAWHGYGKVFGGPMAGMVEGVAKMGFPMPEFFAWAAALSELLGGVFLVLGFMTRPAALFVAITMVVAAFVAHGPDPFKVKELALAYLVMAIALLLTGPGRLSIDGWLCKRGGQDSLRFDR